MWDKKIAPLFYFRNDVKLHSVLLLLAHIQGRRITRSRGHFTPTFQERGHIMALDSSYFWSGSVAAVHALHRARTVWLRSTVGRTPVFGRRTDLLLRSACSRQVITMWVNRPLQVNQLGQLSLTSFRGR